MSAFETPLLPKLIDRVRHNDVDRNAVPADTGAVPFYLSVQDFQAGLIPSGVVTPKVLAEVQAFILAEPSATFVIHRPQPILADGSPAAATTTAGVACVAFAPPIVAAGRVGMTGVMAALLQHWRVNGIFLEYLSE